MLRLTLEIVPYGKESRARIIGRMKISNVGGDEDKGNYAVSVTDTDTQEETLLSVKRFLRSRRAWSLVLEALKKYERGKK